MARGIWRDLGAGIIGCLGLLKHFGHGQSSRLSIEHGLGEATKTNHSSHCIVPVSGKG